jgi:hypothetical protein
MYMSLGGEAYELDGGKRSLNIFCTLFVLIFESGALVKGKAPPVLN